MCAYAGDFVDRGSFSVEVILTLMAWRVLLPGHMHMARGNHESKGMNKIYGFEGEVGAQPPGTLRAVATNQDSKPSILQHCTRLGSVFVSKHSSYS